MNSSLEENASANHSLCDRQHWKFSWRIVELSSYTAFYIVGAIGSLLALIHLYQKRNFKNPKHAIMLKCLMGCDLLGICGMLIQLVVEICMKTHFFEAYKNYKIIFCRTRVLWRFFGLNSGCVAFTMALERYFALTKPFLYYKYITKGLIKKTIFSLWVFSGIVIFCPLFGFGTYYIGDEKNGTVNCTRYREAKEFKDVLYSYILFTVGVSLCVCILICNFSVSKILLRSYHQMQLRLSSFEIAHSTRQGRTSKGSLQHQNSDFICNNGSFVSRDELRFGKLMILLSFTFVICWGSTMLTIPLAHMGFHYTCFDIITNILMLLHFTLDPFIYVLFKTNYWMRFKKFLSSLTTRPNRNSSRNMSMISTDFSGICRIEMKPL